MVFERSFIPLMHLAFMAHNWLLDYHPLTAFHPAHSRSTFYSWLIKRAAATAVRG